VARKRWREGGEGLWTSALLNFPEALRGGGKGSDGKEVKG